MLCAICLYFSLTSFSIIEMSVVGLVKRIGFANSKSRALCGVLPWHTSVVEHTSGNVMGGVVGYDCDVYLSIPLQMICADVDLKEGFQFLVTFFFHADCFCVFDASVFNANAGLFHLLFHNFGSELCVFVRQYGYRDVRVSGENRYRTFHDRGRVGGS